MEVKISSKTEQPLLSRTVLKGLISFDAETPSRSAVRKKLSEALKSEESLITITEIATAFGSRSANLTAHIYKSKEDIKKFESKTVLNRHLTKEEKEKVKADSSKEDAAVTSAPADTSQQQKPEKKEEKDSSAANKKQEPKKDGSSENKKDGKTEDKKDSSDKK